VVALVLLVTEASAVGGGMGVGGLVVLVVRVDLHPHRPLMPKRILVLLLADV
jgi:hypothetical protein